MTRKEYWHEITSCIDCLIDENKDANENELCDLVFELADGHQWIIYYSYNADVIRFTENRDYYQDNFGLQTENKDFSDIQMRVAFGAFYADLLDELNTRDLE